MTDVLRGLLIVALLAYGPGAMAYANRSAEDQTCACCCVVVEDSSCGESSNEEPARFECFCCCPDPIDGQSYPVAPGLCETHASQVKAVSSACAFGPECETAAPPFHRPPDVLATEFFAPLQPRLCVWRN